VVLANEVILHCWASSIPWNTFERTTVELFENDRGVFNPVHHTTMRIKTKTVYKPTTHVLQLAVAFPQKHSHSDSFPAAEQLCARMASWVVDWTGKPTFEPLHRSPPHRDASLDIPTPTTRHDRPQTPYNWTTNHAPP